MAYTCGVYELAHDLAAIIDPTGQGRRRRDIDLGKCAVFHEKAMNDACGVRLNLLTIWPRSLIPMGGAPPEETLVTSPGEFNLDEHAVI